MKEHQKEIDEEYEREKHRYTGLEDVCVATTVANGWQTLTFNFANQAAGMAKDFGWGAAAREYEAIYRKIKSTSSSPSRSGA